MITRIRTKSREEWKALRRGYIGGSDAAAVLGLDPFRSPWSLWAEKVGAAPPFEGSLAAEVGSFLEAFVAAKFEQETGKTVRRCNLSLVNDRYPWAVANIDRTVVGEDAGLEIKTTSALNARRFREGDCPERYRAQCLHYLAVTERAKWYLAVLVGNCELRIYEIERDEEEIRALMEAERDFWQGHVLTQQAPEPDGSEATSEAIRRRWPSADGGEAETDLSAEEESLRAYVELGGRIRELEREREEMANRVKVLLGGSPAGRSGNYEVSWREQTRSSFDRGLFTKLHPEVDLAPCCRESRSRVFRVTEKAPAAQ